MGRVAAGLLAAVVLLVAACSTTEQPAGTARSTDFQPSRGAEQPTGGDDQRFPDVLRAELEPAGETWRLTATMSSPYDSPERYADAFRALDDDGKELGVRELLHDHADEQPFTRSLDGLEIPGDVERITVQGRDLEHGWGGGTATVEVPR